MRFSNLRKKAASPRCRFFGTAAYLVLFLPVAAFSAEYEGKNVDGPRYCAFARSLETGKYYKASVVFDQNHADVRLESGKRLDFTLDKQAVEDPEEVLATDPYGRWWALSVDGLDDPADRSESLTLAQAESQ
jgi:hypothetical protein